jgi:hypothetical protein
MTGMCAFFYVKSYDLIDSTVSFFLIAQSNHSLNNFATR